MHYNYSYCNGHIMQKFGLNSNYGIFIAIGIMILYGFWNSQSSIFALIKDINNNKANVIIKYCIENDLIFIKKIISFSIQYFIITFALLLFIKIIFWNSILFSIYLLSKFIIFVFLELSLWGAFILFLSSIFKVNRSYDLMWSLIFCPIESFGGLNFSWLTMNKVFPIFSYINLLNPMIYVMEGIRGILIKTEWFIPLYICCIAIIFFTLLLGYIGIYRLKKFLDLI